MMTQIAEITITSPDGFYNYEFCVDGKLIVKIEYNQNLDFQVETQPWTVVVNGNCLTSFATYASAESYIPWHYKQRSLPEWVQDIDESEPERKISSHTVKCVLTQQEYVTIEGNSYCCGVKTRQIEILVDFLTENAVQAMLDSLGLNDQWELVEWWNVQIFALEPSF